MEKITDSWKKMFLASIGAAAVTVERSQEILDELVKKGEITVEQGKVLNEELRHNIKQTVKGESKEEAKEEPKDAASILEGLSAEQIAALKEALANLDAAGSEAADEPEA